MRANQKWKESINEKLFFMNTMQDRTGNGIHSARNSIKPMNSTVAHAGPKSFNCRAISITGTPC